MGNRSQGRHPWDRHQRPSGFKSGVSLAELRQTVRGEDGGGSSTPPASEPQRISDVIERMRTKGKLP